MTLENFRIAEIINDGLKHWDFDFEKPVIASHDIDISNFWKLKHLVQFSTQSPMSQIFNQCSKNRFGDLGQFHHFKGVKIALQIIANRSIQISDLFSNDANDFSEYTEFYKRVGLFHLLLPKDYADQVKEKRVNMAAESLADIDRKNIFVLCFTQDNHNEKFWYNYASKDEGVSIGFRFSNFKLEPNWLYNFRDVFYDKGYSFDFYNHINYHLKKEFGKTLFADDLVTFSKFYKRSKYSWENETRLCFHYDDEPILNYKNRLNKIFPIETDSNKDRRFINLPLKGNSYENPFFDLDIDELVCGRKVSTEDFSLLKSSLNKSFPQARIWQR